MLLEYTKPTSWNSKMMNWGNPDPCKADYWCALREAIEERLAAIGQRISVRSRNTILDISPRKIATYEWAEAIRNQIHFLAERGFIDLDYDYADDGSDFPHYLTKNELITKNCNVSKMPTRGAPLKDFSEWMKACKATLCRMTAHEHMMIYSTHYQAHGNGEAAGMNEAISDAIEEATDNDPIERHGHSAGFTIESWTSAEQRWIQYAGGRTKGYMAECSNTYEVIKNVKSFLHDANPKVAVAVMAKKPSLGDARTFDFFSNQFNEGMNLSRHNITETEGEGLFVGKNDQPTQNLTEPEDEYPSSENYDIPGAFIGAGCRCDVRVILDYKTSGGFKFQ